MRRCLILLFLLPLGACAGYGAEYRELLVKEHSAEDIYKEIVRYARVNHWRPDGSETDPGQRIYLSRWRGGGGPILGRDGGKRTRLFAQVVRPRDSEGWLIQYYFEQQRIGEVGRGMDPKDDDWEGAGQDSGRERQFEYALSYNLLGKGYD